MATTRVIRPSRRRVPQVQRRRRIWARQDFTTTPVAAGTATDLLTDFYTDAGLASAPPGVTVGGILLDFTAVQTVSRASSTDSIQIGILVDSETTAAQVSRPATDKHSDWLWWQQIAIPGAAAGDSYSTANTIGGPIRIRSRRRMDEIGMRLWFVTELTGTTNVDLTVRTSVLLLMP
jgi:hypothetical protein